MRNDLGIVKRLLMNRPDLVAQRDSRGVTPLMLAAHRGHTGILGLLLQHETWLDAVEPKYHCTAFHMACMMGNEWCALELAQAGCNMERWTSTHLTGRELAQRRGHTHLDTDQILYSIAEYEVARGKPIVEADIRERLTAVLHTNVIDAPIETWRREIDPVGCRATDLSISEANPSYLRAVRQSRFRRINCERADDSNEDVRAVEPARLQMSGQINETGHWRTATQQKQPCLQATTPVVAPPASGMAAARRASARRVARTNAVPRAARLSPNLSCCAANAIGINDPAMTVVVPENREWSTLKWVNDSDEEPARLDAATAALESLLRLGAPHGDTDAAISAWYDERVLPMSDCAKAALEVVATVLYEEQAEARWVSDTEQAMLLSLSEQ
jgi:hypothetical protein